MKLSTARCAFSVAISRLVLRASEFGLDVAYDEVTERLTEKDPTSDHMEGSLHGVGLAADLLLYRKGVYLTNSEEYRVLGQIWESMGKELGLELVWGGRFTKVVNGEIRPTPDGNHFALRWQGKS